ncbi:uncharacterized protein ACLA_062080 [Aspergillus clavatus NRRL 1]|uniref:Nuclear protein Qri2/Nse4 n=1 Tax=Aspergillus clavatus (strain ATCC 1007 / CBS 513.65 / DSM 816 / NCTC 3887 / NRRL 1 / QM 1276 / 107) TaxID=344612 RepID=A1CCI8_ASPCL|nr:uncharacterized protein ACLA_062080 [Aspergillus clavatus NRRL 1]EAW12245.1 conserved hypothetical protein [Aspergillus clavatus NRRL 1]
MTSKLFPGEPNKAMVIRKVTPEITTFSVPFSRFGLFKFGGRGTLVKLSTGSLAIISPVALTPEVQDIVATEGGKVKYIVAPDIEHHLHVSSWRNAFPDARIIAPEGLYEKRQKSSDYTDSPFEHVLTRAKKHTDRISEEFHADFEVEYMDGHGNREIVLLHKPTGTLIEADLLFNMPATEQYSRSEESATAGVLNKLFMPLLTATANPPTWHRRLAWYAFSKPDRDSFTESIRRIYIWNFDRIIPCHGDVIEKGGKEVFARVFDWFLTGKQKI